MGSFAEDVVVERTAAGHYRAELNHDWDLVAVPQGGVIAALALRAAGLEVDDPDDRRKRQSLTRLATLRE